MTSHSDRVRRGLIKRIVKLEAEIERLQSDLMNKNLMLDHANEECHRLRSENERLRPVYEAVYDLFYNSA